MFVVQIKVADVWGNASEHSQEGDAQDQKQRFIDNGTATEENLQIIEV